MNGNRKLLVGGVIAILAVAGVPVAYEAWNQQRRVQSYEDYIGAKKREIACLDALLAKGVPEGMDVTAEVERCKRVGQAG